MSWFLTSSLLPRIRTCTYSMSTYGIGPNDVVTACRLLASGKVVALPTDTIYGLAAVAQDTVAVSKLYNIKGRDCKKPIAICVANVDDIHLWGHVDKLPRGLLAALLPGPVTVVLNRTAVLNPNLNPDTNKVGIRIPGHSFIQNIATLIGKPLALTSANKSSEPSCLRVQEFEHLWPSLGAVFDGGLASEQRSGSTVVDLSNKGCYTILRQGSGLEHTREVLHSFNLFPVDDSVNCIEPDGRIQGVAE